MDGFRHDGTVQSDAELMARLRRGSEAAFTELFRRHQGPIFRFAARMGAPAADEIVQEVFLELLRQPGRWSQEQGNLAAFLHGIARHKLLRVMGKERRFVDAAPAEDREAASLDADILSTLVQDERALILHQAVLSLPLPYREAIVLCDIEELSYDEAAERMGCPVGTVRSRLSRARSMVAEKLKIRIGCVS